MVLDKEIVLCITFSYIRLCIVCDFVECRCLWLIVCEYPCHTFVVYYRLSLIAIIWFNLSHNIVSGRPQVAPRIAHKAPSLPYPSHSTALTQCRQQATKSPSQHPLDTFPQVFRREMARSYNVSTGLMNGRGKYRENMGILKCFEMMFD